VIPLRDTNPTRHTPYVTLLLVLACFVVFFYELSVEAAQGQQGLDRVFEQYGMVPDRFFAALGAGHVTSPAVIAAFTSLFLHSGWLHILGNMLYLWIFGNNVEDRMGAIPFLLFYLAGGFVAALTQALVDPTSPIPLVGASGAIAAGLGAYLVLFPGARVQTLIFLGIFIQLISIPAVIVLGFWFILQLVDAQAALGQVGSGGGVAFFAHVGGFVFGMAVGFLVRSAGPRTPAGYRWG
jgi:membrane associated rhomboid family serine protease